MNRSSEFITTDTVFWSDELEVRLCELYVRDIVAQLTYSGVDEENGTTWQIYVVTRPSCPYAKSEAIGDQTIHFIKEGTAEAYHKALVIHRHLLWT